MGCRAGRRCAASRSGITGSPSAEFSPRAGTERGWSVLAPAVPAAAMVSQLNGVSCVSTTSCIAVGSYTTNLGIEKTLAERYHS